MQYDGRALELDKVLKMVAEETACPDARAAALALEPSSSYPEVCRRLEETDGAFVLMAKYGAPSFGGLSDVRNALRRAQAGGALNLTEFLRIAAVLRTLRAIVEWRSRSAGIKTALDRRFDRVAPNKYLEERIDSVVAVSYTHLGRNCCGVEGRLALYRRYGQRGRGWLYLPGRPEKRRDHQRRGEHLSGAD